MSIQPESNIQLTRSPETGGSQNNYLMDFSSKELEAFGRVLDFEQVIIDRNDDPLFDAIFGAEVALEDFYSARLMRLLPSQADLIRWVFYQSTREQAENTVKASRAS